MWLIKKISKNLKQKLSCNLNILENYTEKFMLKTTLPILKMQLNVTSNVNMSPFKNEVCSFNFVSINIFISYTWFMHM